MRTNFVPKRRGELWSDWGLVSWPDDLLANFHIDSEECSPTDVESVADRPPPYWTPAVEHAETDRDVVIRCELPGVAPENLVVSLSPTRLIIAGEKRDDDYGRLGTVCRLERRFGEFRRLIPLPPGLDLGRATTHHRHGVLTVRIPWVVATTARRVPIKKG